MLVDGADDAEAVDDFVADEIGVIAADFAVVKIVILAAIFYERGESWGKFFRLVLGDEVHNVIGNECGKPADVFAGGFQVVGGPNGGGGHDFDFAEVAASFLGAFADEAEAPVDEVGIGELKDHAVTDASGGAQGFRAVAGDPDARNFAVGPRKFCGNAIEVDRFACIQVAEDADEFLEVFERGGLFAEDASGTVSAADTEFHAAVRGKIQSGEKAGGDGHIADSGVGDASAEAHFLGVGGHQGEQRKRLLPDDVGIENPAEGEAGGFGLAGEAQDSINGDVGFDGDAEVHGKLSSSVRRLGNRCNPVHQCEVEKETYQEAHEPGVVVQDAQRRKHQADECDSGTGRQCKDGRPIETAGVFVAAIALIEILDDEDFLAHYEVVADEHAGNRPEKAGVADEPSENITAIAGQESPRLQDDAHGGGDEAAGAKTDAAGGEIGKIVCRRHHVGGDVDVERGHQQSDHGQDHGPRIAEARQDRNRIPQRLAKNDQGGGSDGDADERVESHGGGKAERLADDLIALAASVAREIRNVQRDGGPESDHAGERGNKEAEEFAEGLKLGGRGEHGAEAAGFLPRPKKQRKTDKEQERGGDALQEANGLDAAKNHKHVEEPEKNKADRRAGMKIGPAGRESDDHGVDGLAADPGLNAKPAAGDEGAQNRRHIGAQNTKGGARKNREGDAILRTGVRVQEHGNQHQHVAEKDGEERLLPVHPAGDHAASEHVGGDVHTHGNPQGGIVVGAPGAALAGDRGEVLIIERAALDGFRAKQFSWPPRSFLRLECA